MRRTLVPLFGLLCLATFTPTAEVKPRLFSSPRSPAVPKANGGQNPIDAFILARLEAKKLAPTREADRLRLLRRVTFGLTGLPPTVAEQDAFLADESQDAYARVVDRLLSSPAFGERMAQPWLDLVRYAETDGQQHVRRLQIPVEDVVIVGCLHPGCERPYQLGSRSGSSRRAVELLVQATARTELQAEERLAVVLADLVDLDDIGVL